MSYELYDHQQESLDIYRRCPRMLNGSEPGTGKTLPTILRVVELNLPTVIVAPAFLLRNWKAEFQRFANTEVSIYPEKASKINLVSVDLAYRAQDLFRDAKVVVVDECQSLTSVKARRTKAIHQYVKLYRPSHVYLLSGTPFRSKIPNLYSLMLLLTYNTSSKFQSLYPNAYSFCLHFTNKVTKRFGAREIVSFEGLRNKEELLSWLKPLQFRYLLSALHDLPDVTEEEFTVVVKKDEAADVVLEEGWKSILGGAPNTAHITSAKLQSALSKAPETAKLAISLLEQGVGPLLIFSDHRAPVDIITAAIGEARFRAATINGSTGMEQRNTLVASFQSGKLDALVATIGSASTGVTLTKSNLLILNDMSWDTAAISQCIGRIRRVSQTRKCRVISVVGSDVDKKIARVLLAKSKVESEIWAKA